MVQKMVKMNGSADMNETQKLCRTYLSLYTEIVIENLKVCDDRDYLYRLVPTE